MTPITASRRAQRTQELQELLNELFEPAGGQSQQKTEAIKK